MEAESQVQSSAGSQALFPAKPSLSPSMVFLRFTHVCHTWRIDSFSSLGTILLCDSISVCPFTHWQLLDLLPVFSY